MTEVPGCRHIIDHSGTPIPTSANLTPPCVHGVNVVGILSPYPISVNKRSDCTARPDSANYHLDAECSRLTTAVANEAMRNGRLAQSSITVKR